MGRFSLEISDDFFKQLGRLKDIEKVAPQMIDAATPILVQSVKNALSSHRETGDMIASIRRTKAKKTKGGGFYGAVRPTGISKFYINAKGKKKERKVPIRNMEKFAFLEFGTKQQQATPVITKALNDARPGVEQAMAEMFKKEMSK